jgi:hypothetical protein
MRDRQVRKPLKVSMYARSQDLQGPYRRCHKTADEQSGMHKICILNYECRRCGFDQWLDEMERTNQYARMLRPNQDLIKAA